MDLVLLVTVIRGLVSDQCTYRVKYDGKPEDKDDPETWIRASTDLPGPAAIMPPPLTETIEIYAKPNSPLYFPVRQTYRLEGPGNLIPLKVVDEFAPPRSVHSDTDGITVIDVHLSELNDVSAAAVNKLNEAVSFVPNTNPRMPANAALFARRSNAVPANWLTGDAPAAWDSPTRDDIHVIAVPPIDGAGHLDFLGPMTVQPSGESLVLELLGPKAPLRFAVHWPDEVERSNVSGPTPFLVFFHHLIGQEVSRGFYNDSLVGRYPSGFDYTYYGLWRYMNYVGDPLDCTSSDEPYQLKGIPYQAAAAGAKVVSVHPCNSVANEVGVMVYANEMQRILEAINAFMFRRAGVYEPPGVGRTALASYSAGNSLVALFLSQNYHHPFLQHNIKELYMFEAVGGVKERWVAAALDWASYGEVADKMIRAYTRVPVANYGRLVGAPVPSSGSFFQDSSDGLRTASVTRQPTWQQAVLVKTPEAKKVLVNTKFSWLQVHELIPANLLTHALSKSGFL